MPLLDVLGLSKSFGDVIAVDKVTFSANAGDILCLLGPSGCGKTTLLRILAGVENADGGRVVFGGESLEGVAPQQRGFGLMFQDLALFPHMNVYRNVAFGLRMQRVGKDIEQERVMELLKLVDLEGYPLRKIYELSGGERQRVALARSLAPSPRLLMLDEPFGALDKALRDSLQDQVRSILKDVGVTSVYVTHDRDEAFAMADRLLFMNNGRIVQSGTPEEVFNLPADEFVARSLGFKNIMSGVVRRRGQEVVVRTDIGVLHMDGRSVSGAVDDSRVTVLIDERGINIQDSVPDKSYGRNCFRGTVTSTLFLGVVHEIKVVTGNVELVLRVPTAGMNRRILVGQEVSLKIDPGATKLLNV